MRSLGHAPGQSAISLCVASPAAIRSTIGTSALSYGHPFKRWRAIFVDGLGVRLAGVMADAEGGTGDEDA